MGIRAKIVKYIKESGCSRTFLAREARISQRSLKKLLEEDSGVRLPVAERLIEYFNFKIIDTQTDKQLRGSLTTILRRKIRQSAKTHYQISKETKVDTAVLHRFVNLEKGTIQIH